VTEPDTSDDASVPADVVPGDSDEPPKADPDLPPASPHQAKDTPATEFGDQYDQRVNQKRFKLAIVLLVFAALSFAGIGALLYLALAGKAEPESVALGVTSLAVLTAFLVGSARRDFVPYQFLHQARDGDQSRGVVDQVVELLQIIKKE